MGLLYFPGDPSIRAGAFLAQTPLDLRDKRQWLHLSTGWLNALIWIPIFSRWSFVEFGARKWSGRRFWSPGWGGKETFIVSFFSQRQNSQIVWIIIFSFFFSSHFDGWGPRKSICQGVAPTPTTTLFRSFIYLFLKYFTILKNNNWRR